MTFGALLFCDPPFPTLLPRPIYLFPPFICTHRCSMIWVYVMGDRMYMPLHSVLPHYECSQLCTPCAIFPLRQMESSCVHDHEREAGLRRSRVMWVIVSTVGLAMLGLMAVGVYREPSTSRVRQYGTTTTLEVKAPRTPNFAEMTHARPGGTRAHNSCCVRPITVWACDMKGPSMLKPPTSISGWVLHRPVVGSLFHTCRTPPCIGLHYPHSLSPTFSAPCLGSRCNCQCEEGGHEREEADHRLHCRGPG